MKVVSVNTAECRTDAADIYLLLRDNMLWHTGDVRERGSVARSATLRH